MPRILVVNDDGIDSEGITVLARALQALGDVTVVAPDGDRSGTSHSISVHSAVRAQAVPGDDGLRRFACSGTPADCVLLGVNELCGARPNIVVSGINRGANLADDVNYSGTVAAAVEATIVGIPAIAVSLVSSWPKHDPVHYWDGAATVARDLAADVLRNPPPPGTYWNINVPNIAELRGTRFTRLGRKQYAERLARVEGDAQNPEASYYWVWDMSHLGGGDDTDTVAVDAGYASITPLKIDRTDELTLQQHQPRSVQQHNPRSVIPSGAPKGAEPRNARP
jgi:5'-nucleotidase